jgi:hypothetical protein
VAVDLGWFFRQERISWTGVEIKNNSPGRSPDKPEPKRFSHRGKKIFSL